MKARKRTATAGAILAASALISACGGATAADPYASGPAGVGPAIAAPPAGAGAAESARPALEIAAARTPALGWVVTDGKGWILYRFDKDRGNPSPKSVC